MLHYCWAVMLLFSGCIYTLNVSPHTKTSLDFNNNNTNFPKPNIHVSLGPYRSDIKTSKMIDDCILYCMSLKN